MAAPPVPHIISGHVYSAKGIPNGATVTLTLGTESTSTTTNTNGEYSLDAGNLTSGWSVGDTVTITANKTGYGSNTSTLVLTAVPQSLDLTLTMSSDYDFYEPDLSNRVPLRWNILSDAEGNIISLENPLGVQTLDRPLSKKMELNSSGQAVYFGDAPPGTPTSAAKWRIRKLEYANGDSSPPTGEVWANGNAEFDKVWDSRATYSYS